MFILKNHCPQILRPVLTGQSKPSKASEKKKKELRKKKKHNTTFLCRLSAAAPSQTKGLSPVSCL